MMRTPAQTGNDALHDTATTAAGVATLTPAEWQFASDQRARLYGWFTQLYAQEVSEALFQSHFTDGGFAPFSGLKELDLGAEVERLDASIIALRTVPLPRLELAADFAQLFLLDGKTSALPYASAYEGKDAASPLYGAAEVRMRDFLAAHALAIQSDFHEPADHLAVPLALMADLAARGASTSGVHANPIPAQAKEQADFLRTALLGWLPDFVTRCQHARPHFDFYPALAALLLGFTHADAVFLGDVADTTIAEQPTTD